MPTKKTASVYKPFLTNAAYDVVKWFAQIVLPGLGSLYFGLSQIWGFPFGEEVVGSIAVLDVFLGALLGFGSNQYHKSDTRFDGALIVDESDEVRDVYTFEVNSPLEDLSAKRELTLKVVNPNLSNGSQVQHGL